MKQSGTQKTLRVVDRKGWREWLERNFDKEKEIWLVYPRVATGASRINYNDAVEEALCFGWIDSNVKSIDENSSAQRFTPRRRGSPYSQANKERLKWLAKEGMLHPSVRESVQEILNETFIFPDDILTRIKQDRVAWENFQKFSDSYKRIRVAYIDGARQRPEEFRKRLANFIEKTRNNKLIGFGGIDKYY